MLVIFGGAGDPAERALLPAVYDLGCERLPPEPFGVFGCGRREIGPLEVGGEGFGMDPLASLSGSPSVTISTVPGTSMIDVMAGDGALFMRRDEVEVARKCITPILEFWAGEDVERRGRAWRRI